MHSHTSRRRWLVRSAAVGAAIAAMTSLSVAGATSASARVKNPDTLCADHEGVDVVGKGWVVCGDGEMFDL